MVASDQAVENAIEEYMKNMNRINEITEQALAEKETATPERAAELDERLDDIAAIRNRLITKVKKSGISREILDDTERMLSIF